MNTTDISRAADKLPCTLDNLLALVCIAERFALGLHQSGEFTGSEEAHGTLIDAFVACEKIGLLDAREVARDRATDDRITRDKEERNAA